MYSATVIGPVRRILADSSRDNLAVSFGSDFSVERVGLLSGRLYDAGRISWGGFVEKENRGMVKEGEQRHSRARQCMTNGDQQTKPTQIYLILINFFQSDVYRSKSRPFTIICKIQGCDKKRGVVWKKCSLFQVVWPKYNLLQLYAFVIPD